MLASNLSDLARPALGMDKKREAMPVKTKSKWYFIAILTKHFGIKDYILTFLSVGFLDYNTCFFGCHVIRRSRGM